MQWSGAVLCAPVESSNLTSLDTIFIRFGCVFYPAVKLLGQDSLPETELKQILDDALHLDKDLTLWAERQSGAWSPIQVGTISGSQAALSSTVYCHAGVVDRYLDCTYGFVFSAACEPLADMSRFCVGRMELLSEMPSDGPFNPDNGGQPIVTRCGRGQF